MLPTVDFDSPSEVAEFVKAKFRGIFGSADDAWLKRLFADVEDLFSGKTPAYAADRPEVLTTCATRGWRRCAWRCSSRAKHNAGGDAHLTARDFELAIASVLLHDSGYLKLKTDTKGTGAKYTFCHILRSCAFAASYLPEVGATDVEVENVLSAINCTGPNSEISRLRFRDPVGRVVGCALATADYLGQLADPHYPDKLGELYAEFSESDDYANVPIEKRIFKSEEDLVCRTP